MVQRLHSERGIARTGAAKYLLTNKKIQSKNKFICLPKSSNKILVHFKTTTTIKTALNENVHKSYGYRNHAWKGFMCF